MTIRTAYLFPGQGSQSVGMLAALAKAFSVVQDTFAEASEALGRDLWKLAQEGSQSELGRTDNTQPVLLTSGIAILRVWRQASGAHAVAAAGHSLGEYTALVAAGAMRFADAVKLVADRGRFMQEAVPEGEGGMAALLGLSEAAVSELCLREAGNDIVAPANLNSPGQVVVAGDMAALDRVISAAKTIGAKRAVKLAVSIPAHCLLMLPAAGRLAERLEDMVIQRPQFQVYHNVDAAPHDTADAIRSALVRQMDKPVRWVQTVQAMADAGIERAIEFGAGKVLTGLVKRIDKRVTCLPVFAPDSLEAAVT